MTRRGFHAVLALAFVVWPLSSLAIECGAQGVSGLGPLSLRSQSPGQVLRLTPVARDAQVLRAGEREVRVMATVTSIYADDPAYHLDMHLADGRVALAAGLGSCWDLELAFDERAIVNAHLDGITLAFHDLFGFSNSGQDEERDTTRIDFPAYGIHLGNEDRGVFARSVEVTLTRLLRPRADGGPAVAVAFMVRNGSIGESNQKQQETDLGLGLNVDHDLGGNHLYAGLNYLWFGTDHFMGLPLKPRQFTGVLAYEWRRGEAFSWLAQYLYTEGVIRDMGGLSAPAHEVHLGAKGKVGAATVEAALIENIITYNNSPDFGLALGVKAPF